MHAQTEQEQIFERQLFTLVDGDKVGDVTFEAGEYTLEQIVQILNEKSGEFLARLEDDKIKLKRLAKKIVIKGRAGGFSTIAAAKEVLGNLDQPNNRHERRKAAALLRRRRK